MCRRAFDLDDFLGHMRKHLDHTGAFLPSHWRARVLAKVMETMSEAHYFFQDDPQRRAKLTLHCGPRRLNLEWRQITRRNPGKAYVECIYLRSTGRPRSSFLSPSGPTATGLHELRASTHVRRRLAVS